MSLLINAFLKQFILVVTDYSDSNILVKAQKYYWESDKYKEGARESVKFKYCVLLREWLEGG